ncbi:hypothetical protein [Bremerella sp. P1]|uniref:hypothetical protein n=1 Tax=Bremerella sp. P1 TaxID=3026424 RepID=UPI0023679EE0|nr:hypothetical protein [Bremerella sp. P1]WDI39923.1 hypothetical protein PSR63_15660 [Bremerella sp. P1]
MQRRQFLKTLTKPVVLAPVALTPVALFSTGCGSLMHSNRVGQPHTNQIDWKIAALNGLGMLFFFVPGVVAFAVDFYTGAIYLPYEETYPTYQVPTPAANQSPTWSPSDAPGIAPADLPAPPPTVPVMQQTSTAVPGAQLRQVQIPKNHINSQTLEHVVSTHTGHQISLDDQYMRLSVLDKLDGFQDQHKRHEEDHSFGSTVHNFFARLRNA